MCVSVLVTKLPSRTLLPLFEPNSRENGTFITKGLLGNLGKEARQEMCRGFVSIEWILALSSEWLAVYMRPSDFQSNCRPFPGLLAIEQGIGFRV